MIDVTKAQDVLNGVNILDTNAGNDTDGPFYTGGPSSPVGLNLPTRTIYVQNDGTGIKIWKKFNTGVNDWRQISAQDIPSPNVTAGTPTGSTVEDRLNDIKASVTPFTVSALTTNSPDLTGLTNTQQVVSTLANRNFGKNFAQAFTSGNFSTTSTTFQTMQTIPSTAITAGNYLVLMHVRVLKTLVAAQIGVRLQINGNTILDEEEVSVDDDDYFYGHTAITYAGGLSGNITTTAQIRKISGGGSVQAESRTLMFWRVS